MDKYKGHFPFARQVDRVATKFEQIAAKYGDKGVVNMDLPIIRQSVCGTTACHAGWYQRERVTDFIYSPANMYQIGINTEEVAIHYTAGRRMLAQDLGFVEDSELLLWAKTNPDIWGGPHGESMFRHRFAFHPDHIPTHEHPPTIREPSLQDIATWWRAVHKRVLEREQKNGLSAEELWNDIEKQLDDVFNKHQIRKNSHLELERTYDNNSNGNEHLINRGSGEREDLSTADIHQSRVGVKSTA